MKNIGILLFALCITSFIKPQKNDVKIIKEEYSYKYIAPLFVVNQLDNNFNKKTEKVYKVKIFIKYNDKTFFMTIPNRSMLLLDKIKMDTIQGKWNINYSSGNVKRYMTEIPFKNSPSSSLKYVEVTFDRNLPNEIRVDPYITINMYNGMLEDGKGNKISDDNKTWIEKK